MDQTHIHLLINHLPVFGSILGAVVLFYGLRTGSEHTRRAAYGLLIISAIGACIAYLTGEAAEETVENISGISEALIEEHEESAGLAIVSFIVLGIASIIGLIVSYRKQSSSRGVSLAALFISLLSFAIVARTAYLGGFIRHTELGSGVVLPVNTGESNDD